MDIHLDMNFINQTGNSNGKKIDTTSGNSKNDSAFFASLYVAQCSQLMTILQSDLGQGDKSIHNVSHVSGICVQAFSYTTT